MSAINRPAPYRALTPYFGDLHNHCAVSYGRGSLADALHNARLQLDFASITVHAAWPDLPDDDPELAYLVDYHRKGFAQAEASWPTYLQEMEAANQDGRFVTFPSFEWHSLAYGDYCIYFRQYAGARILDAANLPGLRRALRATGVPAYLIPHHIGYRQGARGIDWSAFSSELSPVAEIFSFHGSSESTDGPYPYLHSMGPRHAASTAQHGWRQGHIFGVIGSTDHHNAFPGSYGYGRIGVWAPALTRSAIWEAIGARRTIALTGDNIAVAFALNEQFMGAIMDAAPERWIDIQVDGGSSIDYIDLLCNNRLIHRETVYPGPAQDGCFKVFIEFGWGERDEATDWDVEISVQDGALEAVEPRLRGTGPTDMPDAGSLATSWWQRTAEDRVSLRTRTLLNSSLRTPATEGISLTLHGDANTVLIIAVNGRQIHQPLAELWEGACSHYLGGFVSPALCVHRAIPQAEYTHRFALLHHQETTPVQHGRDWYFVRVRQHNDQWAWSSPIWVKGASSDSR